MRLVFGLAVFCGILDVHQAAGQEPRPSQRVSLLVRETAGIRRFGYPVSAALPLTDPALRPEQFRLLEKGKPVPAQFSRVGNCIGLDFGSSPGPFETREYVIEYGPEVRSASRTSGGLAVEVQDKSFRVHLGKELEFIVPRNLLGLLDAVRNGSMDYLRTGSAGLLIGYRDNITYRVGGVGPHGVPTQATIEKAGPLAARLRFTSTEALRGGRSVPSEVVMDFSAYKSWVNVTWTVDDPNGYVAGLGADVNLQLAGLPTLIDFGAGSLVYAQLRRGEAATLRAGEGGDSCWEVLTGRAEALTPYVLASRATSVSRAEGWAHIMDRERCTAIAVEGFSAAKQVSDITAQAEGRLRLWKHFTAPRDSAGTHRKELRFWLHFVSMPVQVGAATSPQAMLAPLQVTVDPHAAVSSPGR
jgi:hypothetical protein